MRPSLLLVLCALAAPVGSAQSLYTARTGVYAGLDLFPRTASLNAAGGSYDVSGAAGYRFGDGFDLGLGVRVRREAMGAFGDVPARAYRTLVVGPQVGYAHRFGPRAGVRLEGAFEATFTGGDGYRGFHGLGADLSASVFSEVPVTRYVRAYPSVGVFAEGERYSLGVRRDAALRLRELGSSDYHLRHGQGSFGLQAALPIAARVFGLDWVLEPRLRYGTREFDYGGYWPQMDLGMKVNF